MIIIIFYTIVVAPLSIFSLDVGGTFNNVSGLNTFIRNLTLIDQSIIDVTFKSFIIFDENIDLTVFSTQENLKSLFIALSQIDGFIVDPAASPLVKIFYSSFPVSIILQQIKFDFFDKNHRLLESCDDYLLSFNEIHRLRLDAAESRILL